MKWSLTFFVLLFLTEGYAQDNLEAKLLEINFIGDSYPKNLMIFQDQIFFTANDGIHGRELWKIENDIPILVIDITEGSYDSFNENSIFLVTNDFIYFTTSNGRQLWKSDGTEIGTTLLLSNMVSEYSSFSEMIEFNSKIYFSYNDGVHGFELWETDGTIDGTRIVKDIFEGSNGSDILSFFIFKDQLFFTAIDGVIANTRELWKTDGTESGTVILKDIGGQSDYHGVLPKNDFLILDDYFFFYGFSESFGYELWKSDGTEQGTMMVKDIYPGIYGSEFTNNSLLGAVVDDCIIFRAFTPDSGHELWKSDGTEAGTYKIKEINPFNGSYGDGIPNPNSWDISFNSYQNKVYFMANNGNSYELWVSDGTEVGTFKFMDLDQAFDFYRGFKEYDNKLYFFSRRKIIQIDYDSSQTFVYLNSSGEITEFIPFQDKVYFVKDDDDLNGIELWESKINNDGLKPLDVNSKHSSNPSNFASMDNNIYFFGAKNASFKVPMISDGTQEGTKAILDEPSFNVDHYTAADFFKSGNNLFFKAYTGHYGNTELYKTDGTPEGTGLVKDINIGNGGLEKQLFADFNNVIYFPANNGDNGMELWRSDGTEEGTYMVINLSQPDIPGMPKSTTIKDFEVWKNYLYFSGGLDDGETVGIWKTNGSEAGTLPVLNFPKSGLLDNGPKKLFAIGEKLFFTRNENNSSYGDQVLYVTEGADETTMRLGEWAGHRILDEFEELDGKLIFDANKPEGSEENIYISDGTVEGTHEINPNLSFYDVLRTLKCGNKVYFTTGYPSQVGSGILWVTDGTENGTIQVSHNNVYLKNQTTCFNENLIFIDVEEESYGNLLKVFSGQSISDVIVDFGYEQTGQHEGITSVFANGDLLYLAITTDRHGNELYVSNPDFVLSTEEINDGLTKDNSNVLIYPNPTSSEINVVSNDQSKIKQIQLYDLTGKLMEIGIYNSHEVKLILQKYNSGIYLLKVQTEKNITTKKVILK